jgi:hypothetical protein
VPRRLLAFNPELAAYAQTPVEVVPRGNVGETAHTTPWPSNQTRSRDASPPGPSRDSVDPCVVGVPGRHPITVLRLTIKRPSWIAAFTLFQWTSVKLQDYG